MRHLHANGFDGIDLLVTTSAPLGYLIDPGTKILDWGCGAGGMVYRMRSYGYDAYGFDIHDRVDYKGEEDKKYFAFYNNEQKDTSNSVIDPTVYRIPFDDNTFDAVFSDSVVEHTMNLPSAMAEIARVLKPDGFSLHIYPKKSIVIEPHIFVPFGARFQSWKYFYFWALMGIRNSHQQGLSAREVADINFRYSRTGLIYHNPKDLLNICHKHFHEVSLADKYLNIRRRQKWVWRNRWRALKKIGSEPLLPLLSFEQALSALYTAKKRNIS